MGVCRKWWYDASSILDGDDNDNNGGGERKRGVRHRHGRITICLSVADMPHQAGYSLHKFGHSPPLVWGFTTLPWDSPHKLRNSPIQHGDSPH